MISIIIPTLKEAGCVGEQVERCLALRPGPEVIVADGGSADGTPAIASRAGARVVACARRGRASQMNEGAAVASGDVLLFLHADVWLPRAAYSALRHVLADPRIIGGAFRRRFDSCSLALGLGSRVGDLRARWLSLYLGDQAIFARRGAFESVGGFPDVLLFEDVAFSRRLAREGRTRLINEPVVASSRRFEREGNVFRLLRDVGLGALYLLGADPDRLARRYYPGYYSTCRTGAPAAQPERFP
jgi:rSAM/selenodomain-associated transferase 2